MALVIPYPYMQVLVSMQHAESQRIAACTFGIRIQSLEGTTYTAALSAAADAFCDFADDHVDSQVTFLEAIGTVGIDDQATGSYTVPLNRTGSSTGPKPPSNVAVLYRKGTNRAGRAGRGRFYLPWSVSEGDVSETGVIIPAAVTAFNTGAAAFLAALEDVECPMYLLHHTGSPGGTEPDPVTSLLADPMVATQRRRLRA